MGSGTTGWESNSDKLIWWMRARLVPLHYHSMTRKPESLRLPAPNPRGFISQEQIRVLVMVKSQRNNAAHSLKSEVDTVSH